jgi:hypothetical protein
MMCFRTDTFFFVYFLPRVLYLQWNEVFKLTPSDLVFFSDILHAQSNTRRTPRGCQNLNQDYD